MASEGISLFNNALIEASTLNLQPGVPVVALSSGNISNSPVRSSLRVEIDYEQVTPNWTAGWPSFTVGAIIETLDANSVWQPLAYQFSPYRNEDNAGRRIILMQPDLSDFNSGVDESIIPIDKELARVSRQQGFLPEANFRVCILVQDNDPSGPSAFQSIVVSGTAEKYDHAV